jgi:Protein of unknown function (FYDLN_acid)
LEPIHNQASAARQEKTVFKKILAANRVCGVQAGSPQAFLPLPQTLDGARFFDLNKSPITCPKCGTIFHAAPLSRVAHHAAVAPA